VADVSDCQHSTGKCHATTMQAGSAVKLFVKPGDRWAWAEVVASGLVDVGVALQVGMYLLMIGVSRFRVSNMKA